MVTERPDLSAPNTFTITRTFDAPRHLVFKAWTEAERLEHWWGPKGYTPRVAKLDLRPGGIFHYQLRSPEGTEMWGKFIYREIQIPSRLVFITSFSDEAGGITRHAFVPNWPREMWSAVTFTEQNDRTTVTVEWAPLNATEVERKTFAEGHDSMQQGWTGTLDQLSDYLAEAIKEPAPAASTGKMQVEMSGNKLIFSRILETPPARVFKAWTDPQQLTRWWGPRGFDNPVCEVDLRPGGAYRIVMRGPDGVEYPVKGTYLEVVEPSRLVMTDRTDEHPAEWLAQLNRYRQQALGTPFPELRWTVGFDALNGVTKLTITTDFESIADRDALPKMGMAEGWAESLERLEEHLMRA